MVNLNTIIPILRNYSVTPFILSVFFAPIDLLTGLSQNNFSDVASKGKPDHDGAIY